MTPEKNNIKTVPISDLSLWEKTRTNRTLLSVAFEMTARCNNNCGHCYINLPERDPEAISKELSTERIKAIVDEAVSLGTLWFLLTGGEPLLRDDFLDIYLYIKKKGGLISLFTNASLISDEHIRWFKKYPPRDIEVTIYGVTEKTHERVTGKKFFSPTMEGVEKLHKAMLPLTLKSTIMQSNFRELDAISSYCRERSSRPFRFDPFLQLRCDGNEKRNEKIRRERLSPDEIVQIETSDTERRDAVSRICLNTEAPQEIAPLPQRIFKCKAGINSCCIGYDGSFKLCSALTSPQCTYDLKSGSLRTAWYDFAPSIRGMTSEKLAFQTKCGNCRIIDLCMWCPAHAELETGSLDESVQYFCDIAEKRKTSMDIM